MIQTDVTVASDDCDGFGLFLIVLKKFLLNFDLFSSFKPFLKKLEFKATLF